MEGERGADLVSRGREPRRRSSRLRGHLEEGRVSFRAVRVESYTLVPQIGTEGIPALPGTVGQDATGIVVVVVERGVRGNWGWVVGK